MLLGFGALALAGLVAIGVAAEMGYLPPTAVVERAKLRTSVVELLREHGILEPGETVRYYYSTGFLSYLEDGNIVTDRRVISYWQPLGETAIEVAAATYAEIADVAVDWGDSFLDDTVITVTLREDENGIAGEIELWASTEDGGDKKFHAELERLWAQHR